MGNATETVAGAASGSFTIGFEAAMIALAVCVIMAFFAMRFYKLFMSLFASGGIGVIAYSLLAPGGMLAGYMPEVGGENAALVVSIVAAIGGFTIGMLMDDVSGTLLTAPILLPIGMAMGISPYHMAAIMGVNLGMGNVTPPTAPFLYLGARICNVDTKEMIKPMLLIIVFAYLPTLILTTYIPDMSLFLPNLLMGAE
jgi:TRAP-type C4-dicarboxylate transport system permease large subunit